jgi:hypothetical protein
MFPLRFALGQEVCVGDPKPAQKFHRTWQITPPFSVVIPHAGRRCEAARDTSLPQ